VKNIKREAGTHSRNEKGEYLKDKISELATNSKNENTKCLHRKINTLKKVYQPRSDFVKDETDDPLADCHILNRRKNFFYRLLNVEVHGFSAVRQIEIQTTKPLVPDPDPFESELLLLLLLRRYKSPGIHQIPAELVQARGETL
jgi:hypothetical protein